MPEPVSEPEVSFHETVDDPDWSPRRPPSTVERVIDSNRTNTTGTGAGWGTGSILWSAGVGN
jgi:hypothetical protein